MQDSDALHVRSPPQYARIGFSERTTVGGNYYGSRRFEQTLDHVARFVNLISLDRTRHTHMNYAAYDTSLLVWVGIALCLVQSAIFAGLNLAIFSVSRLRLEVQAATGERDAVRVLGLRKESNFVLVTVLWGNVSINVLITLLSNSVLAGVGAFVFSTFVITFLGEIIPQALCVPKTLSVLIARRNRLTSAHHDCAARFRIGRPGRVIQVEEPA